MSGAEFKGRITIDGADQAEAATTRVSTAMGGLSGAARTMRGSLSASIVAMQMAKSIMGDVYRGAACGWPCGISASGKTFRWDGLRHGFSIR